MALTINTNLSSMIVQSNLSKATTSLNKAIERMTTGYKINHAADNAAGYSIARNWEARLGSLDVAADNAATGADMLTTLEDHYSLISSHIQRVRDLTEQAANGTYGSASLKAINAEITARLEEVDRIASNCEFNGIDLMLGTGKAADTGLDIQVGIDGSAAKSRIHLNKELFSSGKITDLFKDFGLVTAKDGKTVVDVDEVAKQCSGYNKEADGKGNHVTAGKPHDMLGAIDKVINEISGRVTTLGAARNRIDSAIESISVQAENITSSLSTLRDADVAEESSNYIKAQILQQASATLLSTANQTPSIALNLL